MIKERCDIMKKRFILILLCMASLLLCSCDGNSSSGDNKESEKLPDETSITSDSTVSNDIESEKGSTDDVGNTSREETTTTKVTERKSHQEFVHNYIAYAEKGAIITYCDPTTGNIDYIKKCETCGTVGMNDSLLGSYLRKYYANRFVEGSGTFTGAFNCSNSNCTQRNQEIRIVYEDRGKWITVYD